MLKRLGKTKADDEPLAYSEILKSNGLDDALWCARAEPDIPWRKLAVLVSLEVLHLMEDNRSVHALEVAWLHACGEASEGELDAAGDAAKGAASDAARDAARAAAWGAASDAAWAAASDAASDAARYAAWDAARDAARDAAWAAARDAARDAAWDAAWAKQSEIFLKFVED